MESALLKDSVAVMVKMVIWDQNVINVYLRSTIPEEILAMVTCKFYIHFQSLIVIKQE